jgi:hypothetical protein
LSKGEFVNKYSAVAISLLCLYGMVVTAQAQDSGAVVVTVPFEFVAGSTTLPAGTYTVKRSSADTNSPLLIFDHSHGAFLQPTAFDGAPADHVRLSFEHMGDTYLLKQVKTQIGTYTVARGAATASMAKVTRMKPHDSTKSSMTSSSGSQ